MGVFTRTGEVKADDAKYTGTEPTWDDVSLLSPEDVEKKFSSALGFYAYYTSAKDLIPDLLAYMSDNSYSKGDIKLIKKHGEKVGVTTLGKIARMINRGMPYANPYLKNNIATCILKAKNLDFIALDQDSELVKKPKAPAISPMKRLEQKVDSEVISHIDYALDEWTEDASNIASVHVATLLAGANIPAKGCQFVHKFLDRYINEGKEAYDKTCEQMVEGYSFFTRRELSKWIKTLEKMKADVSKYEKANTKAIVRVKKVKPAGAQVRDMNYDKENSDVSAVKIPGSTHVVLFNQKTRKLQKYSALTRNGLSVRGTSIKDFDKDKSQQFTVRANQVETILSTADLVKGWDKLKGNKQPVNGRVNEHCKIILCK
jgi:hypothetical protein